jgi:hypothetical protein
MTKGTAFTWFQLAHYLASPISLSADMQLVRQFSDDHAEKETDWPNLNNLRGITVRAWI